MSASTDAAVSQVALLVHMETVLTRSQALQIDMHVYVLRAAILNESDITPHRGTLHVGNRFHCGTFLKLRHQY